MSNTALVLLLGIVCTLFCTIDGTSSTPNNLYDYIVIGGGGGGSAMAARLSEDPSRSVFVINRGADEVCTNCDNTVDSSPDLLNGDLYKSRGADYFTTPQLFTGRNVREIRSNLPGGGTRYYGGVSIPSTKNLINSKWPADVNYEVMRPYFNKLQDHFCHYFSPAVTGITDEECTKYHGVKGGPMTISPLVRNNSDNQYVIDLKAAIPSVGIRVVPDPYNPEYQTGDTVWTNHAFHVRSNPNDINSRRTRESTWTGYLPASLRASRRNLVYQFRAEGRNLIFLSDLSRREASRFGFDRSAPNAATKVVGVRYEFDDEFYDVYARRHVVLSAGAEGTPHFLQHNGIGPADLLNRYGIPIRAVNNHIGQNLAAHAAIPLAYVANQPIFTSPDSSNGQFFKGHLTTPLAEGFPDIELEFFFGLVIRNFDSPLTGPDQLYLTTPTVNGAYPFLSVSVEVVNPQWRGSVNITGDKFSFPSSVDYGWPSDPNVYATSQDFAKHQYGFAKHRSAIRSLPPARHLPLDGWHEPRNSNEHQWSGQRSLRPIGV